MSARSDRARAFGEEAATRLEAQLEELTTETAIRVQLGIAIADAYEKGAEIEERAGVEQIEGILAMARGTVTIDVSEIRRAYDMGVKAGAASSPYRNLDKAEHDALRVFRMSGGERILQLANTIGRHWRDQDGVNGALLDELAEWTTGAAPKVETGPHRLIIWAKTAGLLPTMISGSDLIAVEVPSNCTVHTADAQAMALLVHSAFALADATADGSRTMIAEITSICEAVSLLRDRGSSIGKVPQ